MAEHALRSLPGLGDLDRDRRWLRVSWAIVQATLFRFSFHNWYGFRRRLLSLFGATLDSEVRVRPSVQIDRPWHLTMGRKSSLGDHCTIWAPAPITIGQRSVMSQYTVLASWRIDAEERDVTVQPIEIGDDVWIAAECVVSAGATVGDGALVGARSTVQDGVSKWTIYSGIPIRSVRNRPYQPATKTPKPRLTDR